MIERKQKLEKLDLQVHIDAATPHVALNSELVERLVKNIKKRGEAEKDSDLIKAKVCIRAADNNLKAKTKTNSLQIKQVSRGNESAWSSAEIEETFASSRAPLQSG